MRSINQIIPILILTATSLTSSSQDICNSFCITNIEMDSMIPNVMNVTIFFEGDENDFINYPYVPVVVDPMWDTLGTGEVNFFGQFGNTSQTYPVNTHLTELPPDFRAYAHFDFDTTQCVLYYNIGIPCIISGVETNKEFSEYKIYPNPFTSHTIIQLGAPFEDMALTLYNSQGQRVKQIQHLSGKNIQLTREGLPAGLYFLKMNESRYSGVAPVIIID